MIRVFVGTDGDIHAKAELVIAHTIRKRASQPVDIQFMRPGWKSGCTGFTCHRFLVPELAGYEGFAIYLDVDMLVLGDIAELWSYQQPGKWVTTPTRDDVSVIDCSAFDDLKIDRTKRASQEKERLRRQIGARRVAGIPPEWNVIDSVDFNTKLVHYSDLKTQPWRFDDDPNVVMHPHEEADQLFWEFYAEAVVAAEENA